MKPNDHPLTNYGHSHKKYVFFLLFFLIKHILNDRFHQWNWHKYKVLIQSFHLIPKLCGWGCYLYKNFVRKPLRNNPKNMIFLDQRECRVCSLGRPIMHPSLRFTNLYFSASLQPIEWIRICNVNRKKIALHSLSWSIFKMAATKKKYEKLKMGYSIPQLLIDHRSTNFISKLMWSKNHVFGVVS